MKQLIFVHGMNNQNNSSEKIKTDWSNAISEAVGGDSWRDEVNITAAFYGQTLFEETQNWDGDLSNVARMSAESSDADYVDDDIAAFYREFQKSLNVTDDMVRAALSEQDDPAAASRMGKGFHKSWIKAIVRTLEDIIPGAAAPIAEKILRQAAAYLFKPGLMSSINEMVQDQIKSALESDQEKVVVGHSLGSIVTFSLLRSGAIDTNVNLYLTAGSPLGIDMVKKQIGPKYLRPPSVNHWINASDKDDFVALHPKLDENTFGPAQIENFAKLDNGHDDPHDIRKYLSHSVIGDRILQSLAL